MNWRSEENLVKDTGELERLYGKPQRASLVKETDYIHPHYRAFIQAAPFAVLATSGPDGLDASPRGDPAGFVVVENEKTLLIPDRRGNNRADSLRNLLTDPRIALLFLIPGSGETLRVNGRAVICVAPDLLERFSVEGKLPRTVLVVRVESVYFQCARAILRSGLWDPARQIDRSSLASVGTVLAELSRSEIDGTAYDRELPERLKTTLY
ncbi:MAG: pyridoxamine 5'-phosphate oxidase family protein [Burkholderiales bacterium]|nr:pyridoxamine 5'-phosphate oxidase family protein [Burkholderiales bacterium]